LKLGKRAQREVNYFRSRVFFVQTYESGGMDQQQQNRALFERVCAMSSLMINGAVEPRKLPDPSIISLCHV